MKIAISGSSGLVGSELARSLAADGHEITAIVRRRIRSRKRTAYWNPDTGEVDELLACCVLDGNCRPRTGTTR